MRVPFSCCMSDTEAGSSVSCTGFSIRLRLLGMLHMIAGCETLCEG